MITTSFLSSSKELDELDLELLSLSSYDLIAFTSRKGMQAVGERLRSLANGDAQMAAAMVNASDIKIAALGRDATAAMHMLGVTADIVPLESSPMGLVRHLEMEEDMKGANILCPVPKVKGMREPPIVPQFLDALRRGRFGVKEVGAYEVKPVQKGRLGRELEMLLGGGIDGMAVSSCGEAYAMKEVLGEERLIKLRRKSAAKELIVAVHGPYTAEGVEKSLGLEPYVSEDFSSFAGLVAVLENKIGEKLGGELVLPG